LNKEKNTNFIKERLINGKKSSIDNINSKKNVATNNNQKSLVEGSPTISQNKNKLSKLIFLKSDNLNNEEKDFIEKNEIIAQNNKKKINDIDLEMNNKILSLKTKHEEKIIGVNKYYDVLIEEAQRQYAVRLAGVEKHYENREINEDADIDIDIQQKILSFMEEQEKEEIEYNNDILEINKKFN
jgi:hypothetical protein